MKVAVMETIVTPGGHEVDFDRIIIEELKALGHEVVLYIPEQFSLPFDYGIKKERLKGKGITYTGKTGINKILSYVRREISRQSWYRQIYKKALAGEFDAVVIPTSTYRYLRALRINICRKLPVPLIFIVHGVNPGEAQKFTSALAGLQKYKNIKAAVLTFEKDVFGQKLPNMFCMNPPAYIPRDIAYSGKEAGQKLRLGFFGQYRREKKLEIFLEGFLAGNYNKLVELLVQGANMRPEDTADFEKIIKKYGKYKQLTFLHKGLFGKEWQEAIAAVDAILLPYPASRYRYHWAGMLFTAIGFNKPVVLSSDINPQVLENYKIGCVFTSGNNAELLSVIEHFINSFEKMSPNIIRS